MIEAPRRASEPLASSAPPWHVVVVGGGVAGLAAATRLAEAGVRVTVLEAAPIAGGRARSWIDGATGDVVDNGQHLLMGCYRETLGFLERIGTRSQVEFQDRLCVEMADLAGEGGVIDCPPLPGALSLLYGLASHRGLGISDRLAVVRVVLDVKRRDDPMKGAEAGEDESAAAYLVRLGQTPRARRVFWDPFIVAALNDRPEAVSALTFRRVVRIGLLGSPREARLGWARIGLGDLYAPAAARYLAAHGGDLRTSAPVVSVSTRLSPDERDVARGTGRSGAPAEISAASRGSTTGHGASSDPAGREPAMGEVEIVLRTGERLLADAVVIAVTPAALVRLLPPRIAASPAIRAAAALATSPILGVNLWFDRPIVRTRFVGLLGTTMQWLFNKGAMLASDGVRARSGSYVSLVVSGARAEIERSQDDLIATALADLRPLFPAARGAKLLHALVVKEREATVSPAPGWDASRPGARTSDPAIVLAGDWTATGLPATIESAALSGHRAAAAVLSSLTGSR